MKRKMTLVIIVVIVAVIFTADFLMITNSYLKKTAEARTGAGSVNATRWITGQREALNIRFLQDTAILISIGGIVFGCAYVFLPKKD